MQRSRCLLSKSQLTAYGLVTLLILTCSALAFAQKEKTIYAFQNTDGSFPQAPVIADKAGNLYGNLYNGGAASFGMTFELSPPAVSGGAWTLIDLHDFTGGDDGGGPIGSLAMDAAGNLYGVSNYGASGDAGLVFELSPPATQGGAWTETVISATDISASGVAMDSHGNLYWTNAFGGLDLS